MSETSNKECQEPLTPCLQSRCKPDETGSTNQDQVHEGAQGSMEQRRRRDAAELNAAKQPPTPVAWADLKVGETYWGIRSRGPLFIFDKFKCDFDEDDNQHSLECSGDILWYEDEFRKDSEGRLMIYATPADAVAAMKAALDQWLEGVGK